MEILVEQTQEEASHTAARIVAKLIGSSPRCVLGMATGSSPVGLYQRLIQLHREEGLDFSGVTTFNLDEYVGVAADHVTSYHYFMSEQLFSHVNIRPDNIHIPDGEAEDIPGSCRSYEEAIAQAGGIDLQILGIGRNGHIGFNEPSSSFASRTRLEALTPDTIADNARFFDSPDSVPIHAVTMGLGTICDSKTCLLLAFGEGKSDAVAKAVEGPVTASVPASTLQHHPDVIVVVDEAAASRLQNIVHYKWIRSHKPEWAKRD